MSIDKLRMDERLKTFFWHRREKRDDFNNPSQLTNNSRSNPLHESDRQAGQAPVLLADKVRRPDHLQGS